MAHQHAFPGAAQPEVGSSFHSVLAGADTGTSALIGGRAARLCRIAASGHQTSPRRVVSRLCRAFSFYCSLPFTHNNRRRTSERPRQTSLEIQAISAFPPTSESAGATSALFVPMLSTMLIAVSCLVLSRPLLPSSTRSSKERARTRATSLCRR